MKHLLIACSFIVLFACNSQKKASETKVKEDTNYTFTYTKKSRGNYTTTTVSTEGATVINALTQEKKNITVPPNAWENLIAAVKQIDLSEINTFEAPTQNRYTDRAAMATLTITHQDNTYTSVEFDHGNPPTQLRDIVSKIVALTETEK